jgi:hypothetical protein
LWAIVVAAHHGGSLGRRKAGVESLDESKGGDASDYLGTNERRR